MTYVAPSYNSSTFTCPGCGVIALQRWASRALNFSQYGNETLNILATATCDHCDDSSVWLQQELLFPNKGAAPHPNVDFPPNVRDLYLEASSVSNKSPRGAAALLRLAVQVLCKELGESGKNINADIASLVKKDLPERVQQALDIVRVTGNNAVHPGQIDADDPNVTNQLFGLLNVIAEYMITMPKKISGLYDNLPNNAIESINKRDNKV
jgi:hypothetical protein